MQLFNHNNNIDISIRHEVVTSSPLIIDIFNFINF